MLAAWHLPCTKKLTARRHEKQVFTSMKNQLILLVHPFQKLDENTVQPNNHAGFNMP